MPLFVPVRLHCLYSPVRCLSVLIRTSYLTAAHRYPWFLPYYRKMDRIVVRSDVMRVFILHAYGGVYMVGIYMTIFGAAERDPHVLARTHTCSTESWRHADHRLRGTPV